MFSLPEQKPVVQRAKNDKPKVLMKKNARETKKLATKIAKIEDRETQWKLNHETEIREMKKKLFSSPAKAKNLTGQAASRKVKQFGKERIKEKHITLNDNADEKENKRLTQMKEEAKGRPLGDHQTKRENLFSRPKKLPNLEPFSKQNKGIALALEKTTKLVSLPIISEPIVNESKSLSQVRTAPDLSTQTMVSNSSESKNNNHKNTTELYLKTDYSPTSKTGTKTFSPKLTKKGLQNQKKKNVNPLKNLFQRPTAKNKFLKFSEIKKTDPSEFKTNRSEVEQSESNEPLALIELLEPSGSKLSRNSSFMNENLHANTVSTIELTSSTSVESIKDYSENKIMETHSKKKSTSVDNPESIENVSKLGNKMSSLRREFCVSPNVSILLEDKAKLSNSLCNYKENVEGCLMNSTDSAAMPALNVVEDSSEALPYKSTSPFPIEGRKLSLNLTVVYQEDDWPRRKSLFQEDAFEEIPKIDEDNLPPLSSGRYGDFKWRDALHRASFKGHLKPAATQICKSSLEEIEELEYGMFF